jgi:DNA-binding IclR family transcriptional regulator
MAEQGTPKTVKSDETLIKILEAIQQMNGAGITEIANEVSLSKSSVYRHVTTLEQHGFLNKQGTDYRIGLRFLEFGVEARDDRLIYQETKNRIEEIAEETGEKLWIITEENGKACYLYGAEGSHPVKTYAAEGQFTELHHLAAGKAILAHLPQERVDRIIAQQGLIGQTENTITETQTLKKELEAVRERGVAYNDEESMIGLRAIGAPIRKADEGVYGAISVSAPANRMSDDRRQQLSQLLMGAANEIEINIRHA